MTIKKARDVRVGDRWSGLVVVETKASDRTAMLRMTEDPDTNPTGQWYEFAPYTELDMDEER